MIRGGGCVMALAIRVAGWTLVHFVWQGVAIAGVAATLLWLLRSSSAQARYLVACAALAALLIVPLVTARTIALGDANIPPAGTSNVGPTSFAVTTTAPRGLADDLSRLRAPRVGVAVSDLLPLIVAVWITGVAVLSVRLLGA